MPDKSNPNQKPQPKSEPKHVPLTRQNPPIKPSKAANRPPKK